MTKIQYIKGDATHPIGEGRKILIHCCNDIGKFGKGFVVALSRKWPIAKEEYLKWYRSGKDFKLGVVQFVKVEDDIVVGNMIGQHGIGTQNKVPPIRYEAISKCLERVGVAAVKNKASVHCPYLMGCGLAGGSWDRIEKLIQTIFCDNDISVTAYDINDKR